MLDKKNKKGFSAILSVLILGTTGVLLIVTNLLINGNSLATATSLINSQRSRHIAEGCVELVLLELKSNTTYAGNETRNIFNGQCDISATSFSGQEALSFSVTGIYEGRYSQINISVSDINPDLVISSWDEL